MSFHPDPGDFVIYGAPSEVIWGMFIRSAAPAETTFLESGAVYGDLGSAPYLWVMNSFGE